MLVKFLQLNLNESDYFEQFESLSKEDLALALKLLATANSASSSPVDDIKSIRGALVRMG